MRTIFDLASVLLFAVLSVIYLHRSSKDERDAVPLWAYALAALACAAGDVVANHGHRRYGAALLGMALLATLWIFMRREIAPRASR